MTNCTSANPPLAAPGPRLHKRSWPYAACRVRGKGESEGEGEGEGVGVGVGEGE